MLSESLHKVQTMYMVHAHECTYLVMHVPMQLSTGQHFFPGSYIGVHDVCKLQCIHHTCIVSIQYKLHKLHWCNDKEAYLSLILTSLIQPVKPHCNVEDTHHRQEAWSIMLLFKIFIWEGHISIYAGNSCAITLQRYNNEKLISDQQRVTDAIQCRHSSVS